MSASASANVASAIEAAAALFFLRALYLYADTAVTIRATTIATAQIALLAVSPSLMMSHRWSS